MKSIACIGMAVADLIVGPVDSFHFQQDVTLVDNVNVKAGGDAANVALNLAALDTPVSLHTKLGCDMFGNWLVEHYQGLGIDTRYIRRTDSEGTGVAVTLVEHTGERVFLYKGGTIDSLDSADIAVESVLAHDMVHSSGFYLLPGLEEDGGLESIFRTAHQQGALTSLDVGWDNSGQWLTKIAPLLPNLSYFLPTLNEAQQISGLASIEACAQFFIEQGVENVVIKAGAQGAFVNDGKTAYWVNSIPVDHVVDTTGAGDGFVSGFLAAIARDYPLAQAVMVGNNAGAAVVQQYGSTGAINNFEQIDIEESKYEKAI